MAGELNLGAVVGTVMLDTGPFTRAVAKMQAILADFSAAMGRAAAGVDVLDESLTGAGTAASKSSTSLSRSTSSTTAAGAAAERAAKLEQAHAAALSRCAEISDQYADATAKLQASALRAEAATQRQTAATEEAGSSAQLEAREIARLAAAQASAVSATERLAAAEKEASATTGQFAAAQGDAAAAGSEWHAGLLGLVKSASGLALLAGGFEVVKGAIDITKQSLEFQRQMQLVQTQAGASASEVTRMSAAVLALSGKVVQSPIDLAKSIYLVESAGYRGAEALNIQTDAAKLATIGNADLVQTTDALVGILQTGITGGAKNAAATVAQLNAIIGSGKMTMDDFNAAIGTGFLATAKSFGVSLRSAGAALALMTDQGTPAASAATHLRMAMSLLGAPAKQSAAYLETVGISSADAGKQVSATQQLLQAAGVTSLQLASDMRRPDGFLVALEDLKSHLQQSGVSATEAAALISRAFGGGRSAAPILQMLANLDLLRQKYVLIGQGANSFGADWTATMQQPLVQLHQLGDEAEAAGISLLGHLGPALGDVASLLIGVVRTGLSIADGAVHAFTGAWDGLESIVSTVGGWLGPIPHILGDIASSLTVLGPALKGVGVIALTAFAAIKGWELLTAVIEAVGTGMYVMVAKTVTSVSTMAAAVTGSANEQAAAVVTSDEEIVAANAEVIASNEAVAGSNTAVAASSVARGSSGLLASLSGAGKIALGVTALAFALGEVEKQYYSHPIQPGGVLGLISGTVDQVNGSFKGINLGSSMGSQITTQLTAMDKIVAKHTPDVANLAKTYKQLATDQGQASGTAEQYAQMLGVAFDKTGKADVSQKQLNADVNLISTAYDHASTSQAAFLSAMQTFSKSAGTASDRAAIIGATLQANAGDALSFATTMNNAVVAVDQLGTDAANAAKQVGKTGESVRDWTTALVDSKTGAIDWHKNAAAPLLSDLGNIQTDAINSAEAIYQHNLALGVGGKQAADMAVQAYSGVESSLDSQLVKMGLSTSAAQALTDKYLGVPSHVKTLIEQEGADPVVQALDRIGELLANLTGQPWNPKIGLVDDASGKLHGIASLLQSLRGQNITDTVTIQRVETTAIHSQNYHAHGDLIPPPSEQHVAQIAPAGAWRVWAEPETGGEAYIPLAASKRERSRRIAMETVARLGGAAFFANGGTHGAAAVSVSPIVGADDTLARILGRTTSTRTAVASEIATLDHDLAKVLPTGFVRALEHGNTAILNEVTRRDRAAAALTKSNTALVDARKALDTDWNNFKNTNLGVFDVTSAGADNGPVTGGSELAAQTQAVARLRLWVADVKKLSSVKGFPASYLRQLDAQGPPALPQMQAILSLGGSQLHAFESNAVTLGQLSRSGASIATTTLDRPTVLSAEKTVAADRKALDRQQADLHRMEQSLGARIERALSHIKVDGKVKMDWRQGELYLAVQSDGNKHRSSRGGS